MRQGTTTTRDNNKVNNEDNNNNDNGTMMRSECMRIRTTKLRTRTRRVT